MNKLGYLNDPGSLVVDVKKETGKQIVNEPLESVEKVEEQAGTKPRKNQNQTTPADDANMTSQKATLEVVKKMYEKSDIKKTPPDKIIEAVIEENPKKTPQELQKMVATRQQLWLQQHKDTYYDPTFNPLKKQKETTEEIKEKEEEEKKKMETLDFQKQEKKKKELSPTVKQGTAEKNPGIAG